MMPVGKVYHKFKKFQTVLLTSEKNILGIVCLLDIWRISSILLILDVKTDFCTRIIMYNKHRHPTLILMSSRASTTLLQQKENVHFDSIKLFVFHSERMYNTVSEIFEHIHTRSSH